MTDIEAAFETVRASLERAQRYGVLGRGGLTSLTLIEQTLRERTEERDKALAEVYDARLYTEQEIAEMQEGEVKTLAILLRDLPGPEHSVKALAAQWNEMYGILQTYYRKETIDAMLAALSTIADPRDQETP